MNDLSDFQKAQAQLIGAGYALALAVRNSNTTDDVMVAKAMELWDDAYTAYRAVIEETFAAIQSTINASLEAIHADLVNP